MGAIAGAEGAGGGGTWTRKPEEAEAMRDPKGCGGDGHDLRGGVNAMHDVVAPHTGVCFGGILRGEQIVGDRDDGEEDQDEESESDKLSFPAGTRTGRLAQPQAEDGQGHRNAHEVKE